MLASTKSILSLAYAYAYKAVKSLKLITDPSLEGNPYMADRAGDSIIELRFKLKTQLIHRRKVMLRV